MCHCGEIQSLKCSAWERAGQSLALAKLLEKSGPPVVIFWKMATLVWEAFT